MLGDRPRLVGAVARGGYILRLSDRHDIRVGIASGMYLKGHVFDAALRIELLAVLNLGYWRWSTRTLLLVVAPRLAEYTLAQPLARAAILVEAWYSMLGVTEPMQVVSKKGSLTLTLREREEIRNLKAHEGKGLECYHPS